MTGSTLYSLEKSPNFERSFKKLVKTYKSSSQKQQFIQVISSCLEDLMINPYLPQTREEPLPSNLKLAEGWRFYKLRLGASLAPLQRYKFFFCRGVWHTPEWHTPKWHTPSL